MSVSNMDRTASLAVLGKFYSRTVDKYGHKYRKQFSQLNGIKVEWEFVRELYSIDHTLGEAYNFLYATIPIQLGGSTKDVIRIVENAFPMHDIPTDNDGSMTILLKNGAFDVKKDHPGALMKVNAWASDIWKGIDNRYKRYIECMGNYALKYKFYNDQVAACLMHSYAIVQHYPTLYWVPFAAVAHYEAAKALTVVIKGLGMNTNILGAMCCELQVLQGRGVHPVDFKDDIRRRSTAQYVKKTVVEVDSGRLRKAIRQILLSEVDMNKYKEPDDIDTYWSKRWSWCVNGAHNRNIEERLPPDAINRSSGLPQRYHKRVFAEECSLNPLKTWDGYVLYSASEKLEHGKSRALYSADTLCYMAFNHAFMNVEKAWNNYSVVIDPGRGGCYGIVNRIRKIAANNHIHIMLDYDDFNSQHTLDSQRLVVEEVLDFVGYSSELRENLIKSFNNGHISYHGQDPVPLLGTLMSGHRLTMFINSVLNKAYLMCTCPSLKLCESVHVGDDVYIGAPSFRIAAELLSEVKDTSLRLNPIKQSVGTITAEFLRTAISNKYCNGYLSRTVASVVSGNWENERKLSPIQTLSSITSQAWTLRNRSFGVDFTPLLIPICKRANIKIKYLDGILRHEISLNGGPVYGKKSLVRTVRCGDALANKETAANYAGLNAYATKEYLSNWLHPIERTAISMVRCEPAELLAEASYKKSLTLTGGPVKDQELSLIEMRLDRIERRLWSPEEVELYSNGGILNKYPVLAMVQHSLTTDNIIEILGILGYTATRCNAVEIGFGMPSVGCCVVTPCAYADIQHIVYKQRGNRVISNTYYYFF